jgi:ABC-type dipeptide/oligopeptide/nickel transport system permease subunit
MAKPGLGSTVLAITAVYWAQYARVIRGEVLSVREEEYVTAARASGCNHIRIMTHHIFPNVMAPVIVMITITTGYAILLEAMLSFLGVGVQPPTPSWGIILSEGRSFMSRAPWITIFPGVVITIAVLGFNFLGDGLRDYLDPYMKRL